MKNEKGYRHKLNQGRTEGVWEKEGLENGKRAVYTAGKGKARIDNRNSLILAHTAVYRTEF